MMWIPCKLKRFDCWDSNLSVCMTALYFGAGILAKMKEGAENVQTKLQARAEIVGFKPIQTDGKGKQFSYFIVSNVKCIIILLKNNCISCNEL